MVTGILSPPVKDDLERLSLLIQHAPHFNNLHLYVSAFPHLELARFVSNCSSLTELSIEVEHLTYLRILPRPLTALCIRGRPRLGDWEDLLGERGPATLKKLAMLTLADSLEHPAEEIPAEEIPAFRKLCEKKKIQLRLAWEVRK